MKTYELLTFVIQRNDQTGIGKQGVIGKAGIGLQLIAKLFAEILHSPIGMAFVVCLGDTSCQNHYFSIVVGFFDQRSHNLTGEGRATHAAFAEKEDLSRFSIHAPRSVRVPRVLESSMVVPPTGAFAEMRTYSVMPAVDVGSMFEVCVCHGFLTASFMSVRTNDFQMLITLVPSIRTKICLFVKFLVLLPH